MVNLIVYLRYPNRIRRFRSRVGYFPNVARPSRYNEKMLWRKIFDHNPIFGVFSDKLATKRFVAGICGDLRIADVYWKGDDISAMPARVLERPIIIKSNHGSGHLYRPQVGDAGRNMPVEQINHWLRESRDRRHLEWAYGLAERTLFAEERIVPDQGDELLDLSVHALDGKPLFIEAILGNKTSDQRKGYFRKDGTRWQEIEPQRSRGRSGLALPADFQLPPVFIAALDHAAHLSVGVDYARFDFMVASNQLYAGEITVYPGSGISRHADFLIYNAVLAEHWRLANSWFLRSRQHGLKRIYAEALKRSITC